MNFNLKCWRITVNGFVEVLVKATAVIFMIYKLCIAIPDIYKIQKIKNMFFVFIADIS